MSKYVDGFVLPVAKDKLDSYRQIAERAGKIWKKHGALEYVECVGEDLSPKMGEMKLLRFPQTVSATPQETIVFAYIVFKSRAHRDSVNAKVMKDPEMNAPEFKDMPILFDMKRMAYGGFKTIVEL